MKRCNKSVQETGSKKFRKNTEVQSSFQSEVEIEIRKDFDENKVKSTSTNNFSVINKNSINVIQDSESSLDSSESDNEVVEKNLEIENNKNKKQYSSTKSSDTQDSKKQKINYDDYFEPTVIKGVRHGICMYVFDFTSPIFTLYGFIREATQTSTLFSYFSQ